MRWLSVLYVYLRTPFMRVAVPAALLTYPL